MNYSKLLSLVVLGVVSTAAFAEVQTPAPEEIPAPPKAQIKSVMVPPVPNPPTLNAPANPAPTPTPAPVLAVVEATALYDNAVELPNIQNQLEKRGLTNGGGHTMGASLLVNCLPGLTAEEKADVLFELYEIIHARRIPAIGLAIRQLGWPTVSPQITLLAATLACKRGDRSSLDTVVALEKAFTEIQGAGLNFKGLFHNLFVAANLMY